MDVRIGLPDVPNLHVLARGGHHLHDANRADGALPGLIEPRLLVALRGHEQVIELVPVAVLAQVIDRLPEALPLLAGGGALGELHALEVLLEQHVPLQRSFRILGQECIQFGRELRAALADHHCRLAVGPNRERRVEYQVREDLLPELRDVVVHHRHRRQAGVDHLEKVFVGKHLGGRLDPHGRLAGRGEPGVELLHVLRRHVRGAHVHFLAGEIVETRERGHAGAGHDDRRDVLSRRVREIHLFPAPGGRQLAGRDDVAAPFDQGRDELVRGDRHDHDVHDDVLVLEALVEVVLEQLERVGHHSQLRALVHEERGLRVDRQDADQAPLDHAVEIARPFLGDDLERNALDGPVLVGAAA